MNNNEFINKYTDGHCLSYLEFQVIAKKYGIYFEKINNDIVCEKLGQERERSQKWLDHAMSK